MRKLHTKSLLAVACALGLGLSSCNKFLDIQPKGTLPESELFKNIGGYEAAMYGVYASMAKTESYGANMTYGVVDVLGQALAVYGNQTQVDYYLQNGIYENRQAQNAIYGLFDVQYRNIANLNAVLANAESPQFSNRHLPTIQGEALGLRAFLHLDMLRLFAPIYSQTSSPSTVVGIPYAYDFNLANKQVYSLQESFERVLRDLDEAERLLAADDDIQPSDPEQTDFYRNRTTHFNKYAVYATKARAYRLMRDYTNAARYARLVIAHTANFNLAGRNDYSSTAVTFPARGELIFGLWSTTRLQEATTKFLDTRGRQSVSEARFETPLQQLYSSSAGGAGATDLRLSAFYRADGELMRFIRFVRSTNEAATAASSVQGLSLIRLPEMYYILAEALYDSDRTGAYAALNAVRVSRGLDEYTGTEFTSRELFEEELMREYQREFPGEGQIFPSLRHYYRPYLDFTGEEQIAPSVSRLVLPWPLNERTWGNRFTPAS